MNKGAENSELMDVESSAIRLQLKSPDMAV